MKRWWPVLHRRKNRRSRCLHHHRCSIGGYAQDQAVNEIGYINIILGVRRHAEYISERGVDGGQRLAGKGESGSGNGGDDLRGCVTGGAKEQRENGSVVVHGVPAVVLTLYVSWAKRGRGKAKTRQVGNCPRPAPRL